MDFVYIFCHSIARSLPIAIFVLILCGITDNEDNAGFQFVAWFFLAMIFNVVKFIYYS